MFRNRSPDVGDVVRTVVRGAYRGMHTHSLRRSLTRLGLSVPRDALARSLLSQHQAGEVAFHERRWHVPVQQPEITILPSPGPDETPRLVPRAGWLSTIPADVLSGALASGDKAKDEEPGAPTGWALFRRLIPHYIECLRLSAATRLSQSSDRWAKQFHLLRPTGPWWPDRAGPRILRVARNDLGVDFLEGLYLRRTEPLLLGYPLSVSRGPDDCVFITPVTLLQCRWKIDDSALLLWPTEHAPRLNAEWTGRNRRRRDLTKMRLWLRDMESETYRGLASVGDEGWSDVADMASSLETFLARDVKGRLHPARLEPRLDLDFDDAVHNVLGLFLIWPNRYTQGSRTDLGVMQRLGDDEVAATALATAFGETCSSADRFEEEHAPSVASPLELSEDQFVASSEGLSAPLTLISGPPGTGKSQVVCALMVSAALAGRSVLFASHSHKALDAVQERMRELSPDHALLARARTEDGEEQFDFRSAIDVLLGHLVDADMVAPLATSREVIAARHGEAWRLLARTEALSTITDELGRLSGEAERRWSLSEEERASQGPAHPLSLWGRLCLWLARLLGQVKPLSPVRPGESAVPEERLLTDGELSRRLVDVEAAHKALVAEVDALTGGRPLADILRNLRESSVAALPDLARALECARTDERERLTNLLAQAGLIRDAEGQRRLWQENSDLVLRHFPLWACTALSVPSRIPLVPGLFDYLIVDEATTCNIAQSLPLLVRAKQAIIVGDRLQTGMVSDLDGSREAEMLRRAGLSPKEVGRFSFSQVSLFDLMTSCRAARRHMLRDHFRCDPEIAAYFSETFYGDRLFVRTDPAGLRAPAGTRTGIHWTHVVGPLEPAGTGCRSEAEAMAIAKHLHDLIEVQDYQGTVGVVTPFKRQAELIIRMAEQGLSPARIEATQLVIATAHKFQGGARDVVLISLCYGPGMPRGAEWFLKGSCELVNVAVSRAKAVCHVFGNREAAEKSSLRHIRRLARRPTRASGPVPEFESPWERRLYERLVSEGFDPVPQYPLAGRRLDLAIIRGDVRLDIEVDGESYHRDPDGFRKPSDHWRDHVVRSLGWRVCRFWVYDLREDMGKCIERVREQLR